MKKGLALLLCVSMLFSMVVFAADVNEAHAAGLENFTEIQVYPAGKFTDVVPADWYYESVKTAYELGLVKGSSETTFNPSGKMTVAEAIALASRIHSIYSTGSADFVQGTPWYEVYMTYATANKLISGVNSDGTVSVGAWTLASGAAITRAQFAVIFYQTLPANEFNAINDVAIGQIPDVTGAESYADVVYCLYNAGIVGGSDARGTFHPNSNIQRSEVAAIATRIVDPSVRKTVSLLQGAGGTQPTAPEDGKYKCYENFTAPDFGDVMGVNAVHPSKLDDGAVGYAYLGTDIVRAGHADDMWDVYEAALVAHGFVYQGADTTESGHEFHTYIKDTEYLMIGLNELDDGTQLVTVIVVPIVDL